MENEEEVLFEFMRYINIRYKDEFKNDENYRRLERNVDLALERVKEPNENEVINGFLAARREFEEYHRYLVCKKMITTYVTFLKETKFLNEYQKYPLRNFSERFFIPNSY